MAEALGEARGFAAAVGLDHADHHVHALGLTRARGLEHGVGLAHARGRAKEELQPPAMLSGFLLAHACEEGIGIGPARVSHSMENNSPPRRVPGGSEPERERGDNEPAGVRARRGTVARPDGIRRAEATQLRSAT